MGIYLSRRSLFFIKVIINIFYKREIKLADIKTLGHSPVNPLKKNSKCTTNLPQNGHHLNFKQN